MECTLVFFQWLNLCVDLVSIVGETWRGQTYRSIESVCVSANCKLRRIFTLKSQPPDTAEDEGVEWKPLYDYVL